MWNCIWRGNRLLKKSRDSWYLRPKNACRTAASNARFFSGLRFGFAMTNGGSETNSSSKRASLIPDAYEKRSRVPEKMSPPFIASRVRATRGTALFVIPAPSVAVLDILLWAERNPAILESRFQVKRCCTKDAGLIRKPVTDCLQRKGGL